MSEQSQTDKFLLNYDIELCIMDESHQSDHGIVAVIAANVRSPVFYYDLAQEIASNTGARRRWLNANVSAQDLYCWENSTSTEPIVRPWSCFSSTDVI